MTGMAALFVAASASGLAAPLARPTPILDALSPGRTCTEAGDEDDVVVCGRRGGDERYRLPLRDEAQSRYETPVGLSSRSTPDPFGSGPCGIWAGQRRCDKAEAAEHGYGGGRDPITATSKIISHLTDPD